MKKYKSYFFIFNLPRQILKLYLRPHFFFHSFRKMLSLYPSLSLSLSLSLSFYHSLSPSLSLEKIFLVFVIRQKFLYDYMILITYNIISVNSYLEYDLLLNFYIRIKILSKNIFSLSLHLSITSYFILYFFFSLPINQHFSYLSINILSFNLSTYQLVFSIYLSIYLSISFLNVSIYLYISISIYLPVC